MYTVAILAHAGTASLTSVGLRDALVKADAARILIAGDPDPLWKPQMVGPTNNSVPGRDGSVIPVDVAATSLKVPDLVVVPGLDENLGLSLEANRGWVPWLSRWSTAGATVACSCTGAFLAAEAGLLDSRRVTTHWLAAARLQASHPLTRVEPEHMIIDAGSVITSAGSMAFLDLVLYLTARYGTEDRAHAAACALVADRHRISQLPYVRAAGWRQHADEVVHQVQNMAEADLSATNTVASLSNAANVSNRTLSRRFTAATGISIAAYVRQLRLERAQTLLETSQDSIERIAGSVGYRDASTLRALFARNLGTTPTAYRRRASDAAHPGYRPDQSDTGQLRRNP